MAEGGFGDWLDGSMRQQGVSQAQLARSLGVAESQVSRWPRDKVQPSLRHLQLIADSFAVPRAVLEPLAGYPHTHPDTPDAELEAAQGRLRQLLEQRVPRALWPAYVKACEALADGLAASVAEAAAAQSSRRNLGFTRQPSPTRVEE
jgi:transcriptional regulator with XRE-family HTH domain